MPGPFTAVVFDLGGVLVDWDPRYLYRGRFEDEAAMETFLATVTTPEWNLTMDAGRPFAEAVADLSTHHPEHADHIRAWHLEWERMLGGPIEPTVELLAEIQAVGLRLFALSNWSAETFPIALQRYPFLGWFEGIVISGEEGVVKPDPEIFGILARRYGLEPRATILVDDLPRNVEAAAAAGFRAIRFTDAEALRAELAALGILPPT